MTAGLLHDADLLALELANNFTDIIRNLSLQFSLFLTFFAFKDISKMLRLTAISFMCIAVFSSETIDSFDCVNDFGCMNMFGSQFECTQQKRGSSCELVSRCTNPDHAKDYQTCECKHQHNGICTSETKSCGNVITGVCPERDGMTWECCSNTV